MSALVPLATLMDAQRALIAAQTKATLAMAGWKEMERQLAAAEADRARLAEALSGLFKLVEDGWLVRNTTNDSRFPSYAAESIRLVRALKAAQDALTPADARAARIAEAERRVLLAAEAWDVTPWGCRGHVASNEELSEAVAALRAAREEEQKDG